MSIKIEIIDTKVTTKSGTSRNDRAYTIHEQTAHLHTAHEAYPVKMKINLKSDTGVPVPLSAGFYELDDASFYVDKYGSLAINPVLIYKSGSAQTSKSA